MRGVPKTAESRGTESILNALILTGYDGAAAVLSPESRLALDNMMAIQLTAGETKGAWSWLQFHNKPWEGDSQYYGTVLAAIALGNAPVTYRSTPAIAERIQMLREYLARERDSQVLIDRVLLLAAAAKIPGLMTAAQQKSIIEERLASSRWTGLVIGFRRRLVPERRYTARNQERRPCDRPGHLGTAVRGDEERGPNGGGASIGSG